MISLIRIVALTPPFYVRTIARVHTSVFTQNIITAESRSKQLTIELQTFKDLKISCQEQLLNAIDIALGGVKMQANFKAIEMQTETKTAEIDCRQPTGEITASSSGLKQSCEIKKIEITAEKKGISL